MNDEMLEHLSNQLHWAIDFADKSLEERTKREKKSPEEAVEDLIADMYLISFTIMDPMIQLQSMIKRFPTAAKELAMGQIMGRQVSFKKALIRYMEAFYGVSFEPPLFRPQSEW